jgi:hypothetical protein
MVAEDEVTMWAWRWEVAGRSMPVCELGAEMDDTILVMRRCGVLIDRWTDCIPAQVWVRNGIACRKP